MTREMNQETEDWLLKMSINELRTAVRARVRMIEQLRSERDTLIETLGIVNRSCASEKKSR